MRSKSYQAVLSFLLVFPGVIFGGPAYHCQDQNGTLVYQDQPCEGEALKVIDNNEEKHQAKFTQSMVQALAKLTKKKTAEYNDSMTFKAMEVLAITDALKSYTFTQVYGVSAKYCGSEIETRLLNYKTKASEVIALGAYYYSHGIEANIDGEDFSKSAQDMSADMLEMTQKSDQAHQAASETQLIVLCEEASQVLSSLALHYSN